MDLTSYALLKASTPLIKNIVDDIYNLMKNEGSIKWDEWRTSLKDRSIAKSIAQTTHVKTLWNIDKQVSLYDFYYPSQLVFADEVTKKVSGLRDLGPIQNFVIQGTAGQGKSIFLRYLCGQQLQAKYTTNQIPVFIELRRIQKNQTLEQLILDALEKCGLKPTNQMFASLAKSGRIVLLLDAFDEIDPSLVSQCLNDIENIADRYSDTLQIIVTSRPDADIQNSNRFRVCKLKPLSHEDHLPFLKKICDDKHQAESLYKVINNGETDVKQLLTTPLMMTLLVMLYKSQQTIPDTVPRFYEELFDVLFYRHDHSKPGFRRKRYTQLDDGSIKNLFSALSFYVRLKGYGVLDTDKFNECLDLAKKACGIDVDAKLFKDEIVKTVCLMQEEGFELSFIHKSVVEYYSASFVRKSNEDFARRFYSKVARFSRLSGWELVLKFLSQIDEYRYSKYFSLQLIAEIASQFSLDFSEGWDSSGYDNLFDSFEQQSLLRFRINKNSTYSICGWQRQIGENAILDELWEKWLNSLILEVGTANIEIQGLIKEGKAKEINTKEFEQADYLIDYIDCAPLLPDICHDLAKQMALEMFRDIKVEAEKIVDREDKKAREIDDLLP